jgi:hypothetical protein
MIIYLFANNPKINNEYVANLPIGSNDILMFFNHCQPLDLFKNYTNEKIVLFRKNHHNTYWGIDKILPSDQFSTIYFVGSHIDDFQYDKYSDNYIIYNHNLHFVEYDKVPSTGFIGYNIAKKYYGNFEVVLVGYDAPTNNQYYKWENHDFKYEQEIYKSNRTIII